MNMLAFDTIRAVSHDFLRVSQCFAIPPKLYKRSEAVVRLGREDRKAELNRRRATSELNKSQAKRGGTLKGTITVK